MPLPSSTQIGNIPNQAINSGPAGTRSFGAGNQTITSILDEQFTPEFDRINQALPGLEEVLQNRINGPADFNQFSGALEQFAGGLTDQLFGAGGAVEQASRGALGQTVQSGFGPTSGGFDNARMNILTGARDTLTQGIAGQAVNLAQLASGQRTADIQSLLGFTGMQAGRRDSLAESLFGGAATINQQGMDRETMDLNRRLIDHALGQQNQGSGIGGLLGRIGGGLLGSALGPIGSAAGGALGGRLAGLLGGGNPKSKN
jgi:hypothetical protein